MHVYLKTKQYQKIAAKRNLTDGDIAKYLKMSRQAVSMMKKPVKYDYSPSAEKRDALQNLLNVSFEDIFFIRTARYLKHKNNNRVMK